MTVLCDKKNCKYIQWNMFYGLHCGRDKSLILKGGKCTNYEKLTTEEMKIRREKAPFKGIY